MICSNCGKEIDENSTFCPFCGHSKDTKQDLNLDENYNKKSMDFDKIAIIFVGCFIVFALINVFGYIALILLFFIGLGILIFTKRNHIKNLFISYKHSDSPNYRVMCFIIALFLLIIDYIINSSSYADNFNLNSINITIFSIIAMLLFIAIFKYIKNIASKLFKINPKLLLAIATSFIVLIVLVVYQILISPLYFIYSSEKYGDFIVQSSKYDKYQYKVTLTSTRTLEPWRADCLAIAGYFLNKENMQAKLLNQHDEVLFKLGTKFETNEPIKLTLSVLGKEEDINLIDYYQLNKGIKNMLEQATLEINPILLVEENEKYKTIYNACTGY